MENKPSDIQQKVDASFSTLILSIGSTAAMSLGLAPNHGSGKVEIDLPMARFNIDMLEMLQTKTKNNLATEETDFLKHLLHDLQLKYVEISKNKKN
jgi:hypothetical protein